jgi:hypothetical protein
MMEEVLRRYFLKATGCLPLATIPQEGPELPAVAIEQGTEGDRGRLPAPAVERLYAAAEWYSVCFFTWATGFSFSSNSVACT